MPVYMQLEEMETVSGHNLNMSQQLLNSVASYFGA